MTKYVFTDGSCTGNGKPSVCGGIGVYFGENNSMNVCESLKGNITNNKAELTAILRALQIILDSVAESSESDSEEYCICTDSKYSISCLTLWWKKWEKNGFLTAHKKPVLNQDLLKQIQELLSKMKNITFKHILAHTGKDDFFSKGNYEADLLATKASGYK